MPGDAVPVVAIDGPSGSGKGTLAERLAAELGWHYLDSGSLYRIVALAAIDGAVPLDDADAVAALVGKLDIRFEGAAEGRRVTVNGRDRGAEIRAEPISVAASRVASMPPVRAAVLELQRAFRRAPGLVTDGRDMGTVVFPDAALKLFLDAAPEERAQRRYKQLKDKGLSVSLAGLLESIRERDTRDRERAVAPLIAAADAIVIDSTSMGPDAVYALALRLIEERALR
jgi:CMP/dCMP kinase